MSKYGAVCTVDFAALSMPLICHLLDRATDLDHCRQSDIDAWLTDRHSMKLRFLSWLRASGELAGVTFGSPRHQPAPGTRSTKTSNGRSCAGCCMTRP